MSLDGVHGFLDVESAALRAPQVGIANSAPQHILSVGSNLYVSGDSPDVLTVDGNVVCEGVKVGLIEIIPSYDLEAVANVGNSTSNTIQFTNPGTGIVTTGNVTVGKDLNVTGNLNVLGTTTTIDTENLRVKDPIIELGKDNPGTGDLDLGLVMTRPSGSSNVAMIFDESDTTLRIGYTNGDASQSTITMVSTPLSVNINGDLSVTSNVEVGLANLFVDTTTGRVGIGKTDPGAALDVSGDVELNDRLTIKSTVGTINKKSFTNYNNDGSTRYWKVASGNYDGLRRNQIKMTVNIHRVDTPNSTRRLVMEADVGALTFRPCIDEHDSGTPSYPRDLRVYKNTNDTTFDIYIQVSSFTYVDVEMTYSGSSITVYDTPTWESSEPTTSDTYILEFTNGNLNAMRINNSGNVGIGTTDPDSKLSVFGPDQVNSFDSQCILASSSTTGAINGGGVLQFQGYDGATIRGFATVSGLKENGTSGNYASYLRFSTRTNGASSINERMRITSTGDVGIGTTSPLSKLDLYKATGGAELLINTGDLTPPTIRLWNIDENNYNNHAAGTPVGTINFSGNEGLTGETHSDGSREYKYANTLYDWARISAIFVGSSSTSTSQGYVRGDLAFYTNNGTQATSDLQERMRIKHNGNVGIGITNPPENLTVQDSGIEPTFGLRRKTYNDYAVYMKNTSGNFVTVDTTDDTVLNVGVGSGSNRSINALGTINASGTDYAEYMKKSRSDLDIKKGDIVGINNVGELTNVFSESIQFVVKSTNPSYVGGDSWKQGTINAPKYPSVILRVDEYSNILSQDANLYTYWEEQNLYANTEQLNVYYEENEKYLEDRNIHRDPYDRIAYCGQVPVNVYNTTPGQYVIPKQTDDDTISYELTNTPTFEQYQISIGKVIKIQEDGRAWIIVKIS